MSDPCGPFRPLLDGLADGEIEPSRVEPHLSACAACRAELDAVRALKDRLARLRLPAPPAAAAPAWRRPAVHPRRGRIGWAAAAAAGLVAILFSLGAPPPPLLALSAKLHDDVLAGRRVLSDLGIPPTATKADYGDGCPCPPDLGHASPFVVY